MKRCFTCLCHTNCTKYIETLYIVFIHPKCSCGKKSVESIYRNCQDSILLKNLVHLQMENLLNNEVIYMAFANKAKCFYSTKGTDSTSSTWVDIVMNWKQTPHWKTKLTKEVNSNNNHECITVMCFLHTQVGLVHLWQNRLRTDTLSPNRNWQGLTNVEPTLLNRHMFSCWHMVGVHRPT
jgi:hypothetical protein